MQPKTFHVLLAVIGVISTFVWLCVSQQFRWDVQPVEHFGAWVLAIGSFAMFARALWVLFPEEGEQ